MPKEKKKKIVKVMDIVPSPKKNRSEKKDSGSGTADFSAKSAESQTDILKEIESLREQDRKSEPEILSGYGLPDEPAPKKKRKRIRMRVFLPAILIIGALAYVAFAKLPRIDMRIVMKKSQVSYQESVFVKTAIGEVDIAGKEIPGEIISKKVSKSFPFSPTGQKDVEQKASGKIIVYNTYSSAPQPLVATTRFEAPDGKIYRLAKRITVPGMKGSGKTAEPGMAEGDIIADAAGPAYNTAGIERLTIPGFKGSDKYGKFYGQITDPVTGGTTGASPYPTDEDIAKGKQQAESQLRTDVASLIMLQIPTGFRYVPGSEDFKITSEKVDPSLNDQKQFSIVLEGEMKVFTFKEQDLHSFIRGLALKQEVIRDESAEKEFLIEYKQPTAQFSLGVMTLPLNIRATYWQPLDAQQLKNEVAGKRELDIKSSVLSKQGVDKISVSFWPFWVSHAPSDTGRISVNIE